ncbi:glycosyltransferase family 4 protein [Actinomadura sp. WAC 06369]|uniref:glycosyltransferase family 4 protein n=1 Tax=Actinomadura sp. WAC 06369 TaxID=2203193 RepID=UPI001003319A|nr:glycosyltransferase family 4 protein [Actinomadura sp. WAC 06369]RSN52518.1 glycosyltransferase family 1 protein [Actinomadura sp. WAC 06369]
MSTRLAVVNWRDPWHPAAGGAERYAWEVAKGMAGRGARVTYITARARGQARRDQVEDVTFVRLGGRFTVYPLVLLWLLLHRRSFDAVIDCQNGIPFFSPWALPRRVPVFCVIHHVHDDQFGLYFPPWMAWVGRVLEGPVSRWTYRRHAFVVVSPSTLRAVRERLGWTGPAHVVHNGTTVADAAAADAPGPRGDPDLVCVTRLVPHKRLDLLLDLAGRLAERRPGLRLHVVGDGPEAPALAAGIAARGLAGVVVPHGYVAEEAKAALVARADLHLSTSRGEGWGLSVIEAAALGVPTVAADVDGLRDAVRDGVTGWLVPPGGDFPDIVERALKELDDPDRRAEVAAACRARAAGFGWDRTTARLAALVERALVGGALAAGAPAGGPLVADAAHRYGDEHSRDARRAGGDAAREGERRDHGRRRG